MDSILEDPSLSSFLDEYVPSYQRALVKSALSEDVSSVESIGLMISGDSMETTSISKTGAIDSRKGKFWDYVKSEINNYYCTSSEEYSELRENNSLGARDFLIAISTIIATKLNIALVLVTGPIVIAIVTVSKIGIQAWCRMNSSS